MMQDAEACLKPNGIIIFIDGDTRMYLEDNVTPAPVAVDTDEPGGPIQGSWFHRIARGMSFFYRIVLLYKMAKIRHQRSDMLPPITESISNVQRHPWTRACGITR
jgi:hypothetical protein